MENDILRRDFDEVWDEEVLGSSEESVTYTYTLDDSGQAKWVTQYQGNFMYHQPDHSVNLIID